MIDKVPYSIPVIGVYKISGFTVQVLFKRGRYPMQKGEPRILYSEAKNSRA